MSKVQLPIVGACQSVRVDEFEAKLWASESTASWVFVTVPADLSDDIRAITGEPRGFGSVRVEVTIGVTTWRTSVFPDSKTGCYVLPVKKAVRKAEDVEVGEIARVWLRVIDSDVDTSA